MTLGDIIREYLETNTMTDFSRESGISRAYAYMLIKNKNNSGGKIVPSWETLGAGCRRFESCHPDI